MRRKLRGLKRAAFQLDYSLYRVDVPLPGVEGARMSVIDIWPEGVERTLMLVHGFAGCAETWEYQINYFARNFRVIVPDLRGHGQSDAPYSQYTMAELVADLQAVVEARNLPERFVLAGHSFGGSIAVEYAAAHADRLEQLVLISTAGEWPVPRAARWVFRLPTAIFRPLWPYRPRWNAEIHVMNRMMRNNLEKWNGWEKMRQLQTLSLVLTGMRDRYVPRRYYDEVGTNIPGAEVQDIGSAKHKVQLERHRAVNRAMERFMGGGMGSWRERRDESAAEERRVWHLAYDTDVSHSVPIPRHPLHRFLENTARWLPKRLALVCFGQRLTYAELDARANRLAHALRGLGLAAGERVMLVLPNIPALVLAYYATLKLGGVVVLPNPEAVPQAIARQAAEVGARLVVTISQGEELLAALAELPNMRLLLVDMRQELPSAIYQQQAKLRGWPLEAAGEIPPGAYWLSELSEEVMEEGPPQAEIDLEQLAVIAYTSGTTDEPRPACLTHRNLVANVMQTRHWTPTLRYGGECSLAALPLLHSFAMTTCMNLPIAIGATMVLLPYLDLPTLLEKVRQHRPSIFPAVPSLFAAINQVPNVRRYGLESISACLSGSAPLPIEVQEAFEKLTRGRVLEGYGLTEASPVTHANPFRGQRREGSIGLPVSSTDARIVDLRTRAPLPAGEVGELQVRGPQVFAGYWGEEASPLEDGWLSTGDMALMDDAGYFRILNRVADLIQIGGETIFPRDVEEVLYEHPAVLEAVVAGVATGGDRQVVKAYVVPRPGQELAEGALKEWCERRLPANAVPHLFELRDELPKSFIGKVVRRELN